MMYAGALFVAVLSHGLGLIASSPPNIVIVVLDDAGWADVGFHGSDVRTPHIDELAAGGVILDSHYVQGICSPSRSELLTGRSQIHLSGANQKFTNTGPSGLDLEATTMADRLREVGYSTHAVGKWHLGMCTTNYLPTSRGFDTFYGMLLGSSDDHFNHTVGCCLDLWENGQPAPFTDEYSTELFSRKAVELIESHDQSQPLFMYLAYQAPHSPLQAPQRYIDMYDHIEDENRRIFAGMMTAVDDGIRSVTDALKAADMWGDTLLLFLSDNGGSESRGASNAPLRGQKGTSFEGGIRVPTFLHGRGLEDVAGTVNRELIHGTDWLPTFLSLASDSSEGSKRGGADTKLDGLNVWDTLSKGTASPRDEIVHIINVLLPKGEHNLYPDIFDTRIWAALRQGNWKILTGTQGGGSKNPPPRKPDSEPDDKNLWLFDLANDPNEQNDLSTERPDIVEQMLRRLSYHYSTALPPVSPCDYPLGSPDARGETHWGPFLEAGTEDTIEPLCEDALAEYEEFKYQTSAADTAHPEMQILSATVILCAFWRLAIV